MVGTASATPFKLDFSNTPGATDKVNVYAEYSGNTITFWVIPNSSNNVVSADIKEIAFNISSTEVVSVKDASGADWNLKPNNPPYQVDGVGKYLSAFTNPSQSNKQDRVTVTLKHNVVDIIQENNKGFEVAAHVAWVTQTGSVSDGTAQGTVDASAYFAGPTEIPEFPTVALPVAAILGLMFTFGRKKDE